MSTRSHEKNSQRILMLLAAFSAAFLIGALFAGHLADLLPGLLRINTAPSQFTRDYFKLGGLGGAFLNTGLIGLACCALLFFSGAECTGLTIAAWWLNTGFGTWGMTLVTIWPFFLGTWLHAKWKKVPFGTMANQALFATALAPFAGELMLRYPFAQARGFTVWGVLAGILLGVLTGFVMPALLAHSPAFHKGYDLYSAGPAAGFLAFVIYCVLYRSPGIEVPVNTDLGDGERLFVTVFFLIVFLLLLPAARLADPECFSGYRRLLSSSGHQTDFTKTYGLGPTLVNMCVYGLFILLYYNLVRGVSFEGGALHVTGAKFTGATMGAVMCMYAFCAQGAHPRNVFPVMIGYAAASLLPLLTAAAGLVPASNWSLTTQSMLVGLCFASGLAPVGGTFGYPAGIAAGALHAVMVMSVPLLHGGFCLYNGGFTAGITAFVLVPVLEMLCPGRAGAGGGKRP